MSIAMLNALAVTVVRFLVENRKFGEPRQKEYADVY